MPSLSSCGSWNVDGVVYVLLRGTASYQALDLRTKDLMSHLYNHVRITYPRIDYIGLILIPYLRKREREIDVICGLI